MQILQVYIKTNKHIYIKIKKYKKVNASNIFANDDMNELYINFYVLMGVCI